MVDFSPVLEGSRAARSSPLELEKTQPSIISYLSQTRDIKEYFQTKKKGVQIKLEG